MRAVILNSTEAFFWLLVLAKKKKKKKSEKARNNLCKAEVSVADKSSVTDFQKKEKKRVRHWRLFVCVCAVSYTHLTLPANRLV